MSLTGKSVRVHNVRESDVQYHPSLIQEEYEQRIQSLKSKMDCHHLSMPKVVLSTGYEIPTLGLGTWTGWKEGEGMEEAVKTALKSGYRHIDCAANYQNEQEVGRAIAQILKYSSVKREDLFISSKLKNADHGAKDVRIAFLKTLSELRLNYLDLYLMHFPATENEGPTVEPSIRETWTAMESLVQEGLVRSIGISNFSIKKTKDLLSYSKIKPAVNQIEVHPYFRNEALIQWCRKEGIHVTAYSPLGCPGVSNILNRPLYPDILGDPSVQSIAQKLQKTPAQVLIRWALQNGNSVLVKSSSAERIESNLDVLDWDLSPQDFHSLASMDLQFRITDGSRMIGPNGPYATLFDLWDDEQEKIDRPKFIRSCYALHHQCPSATLNNGAMMPLVGLGTWRSEPNEIKNAALQAIRAGYRHVDCAYVYNNEHEIGEALDQIFKEGVVRREDLWITSKLWNTDHARARVFPAVQKSLSDLRLDCLDLYLIHWPVTGNRGPTVEPSIKETWQAMEELVEAGLVRSLGVSNFSIKKVQQILTFAKIRPAVVQVEIHPYFRNDGLIQWCKKEGIHVTAYSPLGGSQENESLVKKSLPKLMENPTLSEISQQTNKSKGQVISTLEYCGGGGRPLFQVLIRWALQHGTSVLPKSVKPQRIKMNFDVLDWELSDSHYTCLSSLEDQTRMLDGSFLLHVDSPYRQVEDLWDE